MYSKESLSQIRQSDLSNMKECLVTETNVNSEYFFICLYRYRSQSYEELESFCSNLDLDLFLSNINDQHYNAKCSKWWTTDKNDIKALN